MGVIRLSVERFGDLLRDRHITIEQRVQTTAALAETHGSRKLHLGESKVLSPPRSVPTPERRAVPRYMATCSTTGVALSTAVEEMSGLYAPPTNGGNNVPEQSISRERLEPSILIGGADVGGVAELSV